MEEENILLFKIVKELWPVIDELRIKNNRQIEFGIIAYDNRIDWFPICQAPYSVWEKVKEFIKDNYMVKQKTVHDGNTRKDASVTLHGFSQLSPNEQWECNVNPDVQNGNNPQGAFEPKRSKDRPCTHKKINDTDH